MENPSWADFEYFLEDRCFPRTRDHAKDLLREIGVPFYDPLLIIEKTKGYMEGDYQWILILKNGGVSAMKKGLSGSIFSFSQDWTHIQGRSAKMESREYLV